ncbi:MAG: C-terminal target protein [Bacteroidota bacterium]|nr:C-terminal target protein [Bacteroidota bacterium]
MKKNYLKKTVLLMMALVLVLLAYNVKADVLPDYTSEYGCSQSNVEYTILTDADSSGVFDSYGIKFCDESSERVYTLQAIGDMRRWPPQDVPTRSITSDMAGSDAFMETYFAETGLVQCWFQKFAGNDTVYFFDVPDDFNPDDFGYDSSAYYIQVNPNPAQDMINIHHIVTVKGDINISLYSYDGTFIDNILDAPSGEGEFDVLFDICRYENGSYWIRYVTGGSTYSISLVIQR